MTAPKVSIIVPVYKTEAYLERCLKSLKEQTLKDIEIILVDDGSPDRCPEICDKAAAEDARFKVIHKTNRGAGYARNTGMEAAGGRYIGFVDSDDFVKKDMFETLYDSAEKYDAQLVLSGVCYVGGNMFRSEEKYLEDEYFREDSLFDTGEKLKNLLLGIVGALPHERRDSRYGVSVCKNLYRRKTIEKFHIKFLSEREIMSEDTLFMIDYVQHINKAVGIRGAFYCYSRNEMSLSKSYCSDRMEQCIILLKEIENRIKLYVPRKDYQIYLDRLTQAYGRVICSQEVVRAAEEKNSYFALRKRLKKICTAKEIEESLKSYPWYKLPFRQAVFACFIKYKCYFLQKLAVMARAR